MTKCCALTPATSLQAIRSEIFHKVSGFQRVEGYADFMVQVEHVNFDYALAMRARFLADRWPGVGWHSKCAGFPACCADMCGCSVLPYCMYDYTSYLVMLQDYLVFLPFLVYCMLCYSEVCTISPSSLPPSLPRSLSPLSLSLSLSLSLCHKCLFWTY